MNFDQVLNDSTYIATGPVSLKWNGEIRPASKEYSGTWEGELSNPRYNEYQLSAIRWKGTIDKGEVETQFSANTQSNEQIFVDGNITGLFEEIPNWEVGYELVEINPRTWTQNESLSGLFTLSGTVKGFGWAIPDSGWTYSLANKRLDEDELIPIQLFDEELEALRLSGEFGELKTYADFFAKNKKMRLGQIFRLQISLAKFPSIAIR